MMATLKDMEQLVDFFLSPNFSLNESPQHARTKSNEEDEDDVAFEGEVEEVTDGIGVSELGAHDEEKLKVCGTKLRKMGDEFLHHKMSMGSLDPVLRDTVQKAADSQTGDQKETEAWTKFKSYLDTCIQESDVKDAYMTLGAVLMVAKGLSTLGSGVSILARRFTMRYIRETQLAADINRMGGLNGLYNLHLD